MSACLAITVDVDGEAGLPGGGAGYEHRLSSRSERLYGIRRGLPRILALLARAQAPATFFVPGVTAERHPDAIAAIREAGHELGLHGHTHRRLDEMTAAEQGADLERGLEALRRSAGVDPAGYRAPAWEMTPKTLRLLGQSGFRYDSSLMEDDRPYRLDGDGVGLVELPVHWSLDDAPYFSACGDAEAPLRAWSAELSGAAREERPLIVTLHPEILGRHHRLAILERLLEQADAMQLPAKPLARIAAEYADA